MKTSKHPEPDAFVCHKADPIKTKFGETSYLIPFSDVHRHARNCDVELWKEFLAWGSKKQRAHFVGVGDYDDIGSHSERKAWAHAKSEVHEDFRDAVDEMVDEKCKAMCDELGVIQPRLIGLVDGNHSFRFADGQTYTQRMCEYLKVPYLGLSTLTRIPFSMKPRLTTLKLDIFAHHGFGGGSTTGGSANNLEKMATVCSADIYLGGHNHHKHVVPRSIMVPNSTGGQLGVVERRQLFIRTGSFLRAWNPNRSSYVVDKCMRPADLGVVKIEMTPKRKTYVVNGRRVEQHTIKLHASI